MKSSKEVREFLVGKGISKDRIGIIYLDKNKTSKRFKVWIYSDITQQLANSIGDSLVELGFFKVSISLNEIIFSVPDKQI
jgi:hypothetical protein